MYVVRHDRVVIDAVALFQDVCVLAVVDLYDTAQYVDELLSLVRGQDEVLALLGGGDLDQERLHVAARLVLRERVIIHVLVSLLGIVRESDTVCLAVFLAAYDGSQLRLVVEERAQAYSQYAGYLDKRRQGGEVQVALDTLDLFDTQSGTLGYLLDGELLRLTDILNLRAYDFIIAHMYDLLFIVQYCLIN